MKYINQNRSALIHLSTFSQRKHQHRKENTTCLGIFARFSARKWGHFGFGVDLNVFRSVLVNTLSFAVCGQSELLPFKCICSTLPFIPLCVCVSQLSDTPRQDRCQNLLNALNSHKDRWDTDYAWKRLISIWQPIGVYCAAHFAIISAKALL